MAKRSTSISDTEIQENDFLSPMRESLASVQREIDAVDSKLESYTELVERRATLVAKSDEIQRMINKLEGHTPAKRTRAEHGANLQTITEYMENAGGPRRIATISKETGISQGSVRACLLQNDQLFQQDEINKTFVFTGKTKTSRAA